MNDQTNKMNIDEILEHLPHRYPMLLVDRVLELVPGESIHAYKNISVNEHYFSGHFPHHPVMPGVLIMEALAQAAGILSFKTLEQKPDKDSLFYFVGIDGARFKKPVIPGDQLHLYASLERKMRGIWRFNAQAKVGGEAVAEAQLMCSKQNLAR